MDRSDRRLTLCRLTFPMSLPNQTEHTPSPRSGALRSRLTRSRSTGVIGKFYQIFWSISNRTHWETKIFDDWYARKTCEFSTFCKWNILSLLLSTQSYFVARIWPGVYKSNDLRGRCFRRYVGMLFRAHCQAIKIIETNRYILKPQTTYTYLRGSFIFLNSRAAIF